MDNQRATVPPTEKMRFNCAQKRALFLGFISLYIYEGCSEIIETFTIIPLEKKDKPLKIHQKVNQDKIDY